MANEEITDTCGLLARLQPEVLHPIKVAIAVYRELQLDEEPFAGVRALVEEEAASLQEAGNNRTL